MSSFTPEGYVGKDALQGLNTGSAQDQVELSDYELNLLQKLFSAPNRIPSSFFSYLLSYIEQANLLIPVGQIFGFAGFVFQPAPLIDASEATTSSTYGNLATVGPELTGLADGQYAIFFGAQMQATSPTVCVMSIAVNGAAASDTDSCATDSANTSTGRLILKTLTNGGNNTLTAKYRSSNNINSASFVRRWLIAVKYANP